MESQICRLGAPILSRRSYLDIGILAKRPQRRRLRSVGILVLPGGIYGRLGTGDASSSIGMVVWSSRLGGCTARRSIARIDDSQEIHSTPAQFSGPMCGMWIRLARSVWSVPGMRLREPFRFDLTLGHCDNFRHDAFLMSRGFGSSTRPGDRTPGPLPLTPKSAFISATSFSICLTTSGCCAATSSFSPMSVPRL